MDQLTFRMEGVKWSNTKTVSPAKMDKPKVVEEDIKVELQEPELWDKFHKLTNEMIVTKNGRRMFPVIKVGLSGLDPNTFYTVHLEFKQIEHNRWKYINGDWLAGKTFGNISRTFLERQT